MCFSSILNAFNERSTFNKNDPYVKELSYIPLSSEEDIIRNNYAIDTIATTKRMSNNIEDCTFPPPFDRCVVGCNLFI